MFPTCPVGSCPCTKRDTRGRPPGLGGACPCPQGWAHRALLPLTLPCLCLPSACGFVTGSQSTQVWNTQPLSGMEHFTFLSPPARSLSGQAAVIASLAGAGISLLGSGHVSSRPFASQHQQQSLAFLRESGARSLCHLGWSHLAPNTWSCSGPSSSSPMLEQHQHLHSFT